jgi:hypothetical protein
MANVNAPSGFSPIQYGTSSPGNQQVRTYYIPSTDTSAYYIGDVVKTAAGGDANGTPLVVKCASGDTVRGVIVGVLQANPNNPSIQGTNIDLTITGVPASKTAPYYVLVNDDPDQVFEIQGDSTAFTSADSNKNASYTVAAPSLSTQLSATVLTGTTTSSTAALKIVGFEQIPGSTIGAYARFMVMFNQHEFNRPTAGV